VESLPEKIKRVLDPSTMNDETVQSFLQEVRQNWRDSEKAMGRSALLAGLSAVVFELLGRGGVGELSLGFAKITNLELAQQVLPLAIAYFALQFAILLLESAILEYVHEEIVNLRFPAMSSRDSSLATLLNPPRIVSWVQLPSGCVGPQQYQDPRSAGRLFAAAHPSCLARSLRGVCTRATLSR
jgi:hypothetical protein